MSLYIYSDRVVLGILPTAATDSNSAIIFLLFMQSQMKLYAIRNVWHISYKGAKDDSEQDWILLRCKEHQCTMSIYRH